MNNYILSIDPSIKDTGFVLWENNIPIWANNYNFEKYDKYKFFENIIEDIIRHNNNFNIYIERGIYQPRLGKGKETLDILRGTICGLFNKFIHPKDMISPTTWQKWYKDTQARIKFDKWTKEHSLSLAKILILENNWNIEINNHNIADALLIGWYVINNKEVNNGKL